MVIAHGRDKKTEEVAHDLIAHGRRVCWLSVT